LVYIKKYFLDNNFDLHDNIDFDRAISIEDVSELRIEIRNYLEG